MSDIVNTNIGAGFVGMVSQGLSLVFVSLSRRNMIPIRIKGGSWFENADICCSALHTCLIPGYSNDIVGFRIIIKEKKMSLAKAKGGSWYLTAWFCRSARRDWRPRSISFSSRGFRTLIKTLFTTSTTSPSTLSFDFLPGFTGIAHPKFPGAYMGDTPTTQKQWKTIVEMFPESDLELHPSMFKGDNRPVESVTYEEVVSWIEMLNRCLEEHGYEASLPTEEEWMAWAGEGEYATATGKISPELACYDRSSDEGTTPVKSFPPNPLGMYDMAGNVYEFVI